MISVQDIKLYLPQYLTEKAANSLIQELNSFPDNIESRLLGRTPTEFDESLLQGDVIKKGALFVCDMKDRSFKDNVPCLLLSNTCDMSRENERTIPLNVCYAPIFSLNKYHALLSKVKDNVYADAYIEQIKRQELTTYFYLPSSALGYEAFVHFDKIQSIKTDSELYETMLKLRSTSLSQYGFYLFLLKLSVHLTRMKENIERAYLKPAQSPAK